MTRTTIGRAGRWDAAATPRLDGYMRWQPERTNRPAKWALLMLLIAGLGGPPATGTAMASATFPGNNGKIAVVVTDPKDASRPTNVMTMTADGSHRKLITHTAARRDAGPTNIAVSPDGRSMVFDRRVCGNTCHYNVGVMNSNGSRMHLLTRRGRGFDTNFGFSPDGSWVGFTRDVGDIFVVRTHGGRPKRLTGYGIGTVAVSVSFSPDGESVAFDKFEAAPQDGAGDYRDTICVVSIATRDETCLGEGSSPLWAPVGQAIVFSEADDSGISMMRPDGSERTRLISGSRMRPLAFSPDGEHFAFLRERGNGRRLVIAKSDGTQRRAIADDRKDFEDNFDVAFSPDARSVIYRRGGRKGFYASRVDGSNEKPILVTPRRIQGPGGSLAWAPRA